MYLGEQHVILFQAVKQKTIINRKWEPARNGTAPAPAILFKTAPAPAPLTFIYEKKSFGGHFNEQIQYKLYFLKQMHLL